MLSANHQGNHQGMSPRPLHYNLWTPTPLDSGTKKGAEFMTVEKQELQMKKAKLVNMLDEVEQRYMQYHHQMHIVVSSFDLVAGLGSATPGGWIGVRNTALALQTISRQFWCLRDAISGQIRATSKSSGEGASRLGRGYCSWTTTSDSRGRCNSWA